MTHTLDTNSRQSFYLPALGQRIVKTTVAVFLCLLVYYLRGFRGREIPTEAAITAIICVQPYVRDTRKYAVNRFMGTLIGSFWGLAFLVRMLYLPCVGDSMLLLYIRMSLGVMLSLYTAVALRRSETAGQAAIVFLCIVISFPDISEPLRSASERIIGVLTGTACAIGVNVFRLPRVRQKDRVFFVRAKDLASNRFSHISSAVLFRLNYLYEDGAKICLLFEHAPAYFSLQMHEAMLNLPIIVMDGAAVYDPKENVYLSKEIIPLEDTLALRAYLDSLNLSYFIYTIHKNKACIFHQGKLHPPEKLILDRLKGSPYRSYLEGEIYDDSEIVYYKIVAKDSAVAELEACLKDFIDGKNLRTVCRPQSVPGISALYIYASTATLPLAEQRLMDRLREKEPDLRPVEIFSRKPYRSEHDAMHLLHRVGNAYEPLAFFGHPLFQKRK
ncbi:MAG: FUSC family protein [Oscillospiraceae bacterium]|nr:FUSC family protein [Oscillospiraceae bacterium]